MILICQELYIINLLDSFLERVRIGDLGENDLGRFCCLWIFNANNLLGKMLLIDAQFLSFQLLLIGIRIGQVSLDTLMSFLCKIDGRLPSGYKETANEAVGVSF